MGHKFNHGIKRWINARWINFSFCLLVLLNLININSPLLQAQPAAAQTFFEANPYYAAAAAAHVQYTAPTSPDYTTQTSAAQLAAAGIGGQGSQVTAAILAQQQQQLQNSGFMQVM